MGPCLVTGGGGFIGNHIVRRLLDRDVRVRVLDNFSTGKPENLSDIRERVDVIEGDIRDMATVQHAVEGVDTIFHLAAQGSVPKSVEHPTAANEINITGTLHMLVAATGAGVRRFVYSASSSAYGDTPKLPKMVDMLPRPQSPYAVSKLAGEHYCSCWWHVYGLETISLRYFNVFGPRQDPNSQYAAVIPAFVTRMLQGQRPVIYGDGEQSRDFCFIDNVVNANMRAAEAPQVQGDVVNVACAERTTLNEIVAQINELIGTDIQPEYAEVRPGDVRHSLADIAHTKDVLGYEPVVYFADGLRRSIDWYRENLG